MKLNKIQIFLILAGTIVWSLTMVRSGLIYDFGMGFWGPNGHDGVWHIALAESLARGSLENPVFAGNLLKNYHIGFDLILAALNKITTIPISFLYFQFSPPLIALFIGIFTYKFVYSWTKSKLAITWSLFFTYFGGGLGYIISLIREGKLGGDSMFWAQSSATSLVNPPFALSLLFILISLVSLDLYLMKKRRLHFWVSAIFFGVLVQIKAYAGVVALFSLFVAGTFLYFKKKDIRILKILFVAGTISLFVFLPLNLNSSNLLVFYPFWYLETMMAFGDRLHWEKFYSAMVNYKASGNVIKAFLAYLVAFLIFLLGNLGARFIGFYWIIKKLKKIRGLNCQDLFILSAISIGVVLPMFFVQKGTPWNTIQFFYYSLFFFGIVCAKVLSSWLKTHSNLAWGASLLILAFTIPTTVTTLRHYIPGPPPSAIPEEEIDALKFLKSQPKGKVLSLQILDEIYMLKEVEPKPLFLYESTAYVSAFSKKEVYFADEVNLNIMNYNWVDRKENIKKFLKDPNSREGYAFLRQAGINYIYLVKRPLVGLDENALNIKNIFDNEKTIIYKVD